MISTVDPPFLHLDLISCRNLLIYFEPALQRKVLETFSSALNSDGILFLGEWKSINGYDDRFAIIDTKLKVYRRRPYAQTSMTGPMDAQPIPRRGGRFQRRSDLRESRT